MPAPRQMFAKALDPLKGWPSMSAVDYSAVFNAADLATLSGLVYAGRVVHLHTDGTFKYGCTGTKMAMFLFQNAYDPDVSNDGTDADSVMGWIPVTPSGKLTALVAIGGYELATTEYVTGGSYAINAPLKAALGTGADAGKLTDATVTVGTHAICGVVSRGVRQNAHGRNELCFWPVYVPHASG